MMNIFSNQKYQFGQFFEVLGMEKVGIFYGYLEYIAAIRKFSYNLVHFNLFGYIVSRNIWQP
jgi:hypothetical protein